VQTKTFFSLFYGIEPKVVSRYLRFIKAPSNIGKYNWALKILSAKTQNIGTADMVINKAGNKSPNRPCFSIDENKLLWSQRTTVAKFGWLHAK